MQLFELGLFAVAYRHLGLGQQSQREPLGLRAEADINELTTASTSCCRHNVGDDAPRDFLELDASQIAQARSPHRTWVWLLDTSPITKTEKSHAICRGVTRLLHPPDPAARREPRFR
jgi:hypothetical protein